MPDAGKAIRKLARSGDLARLGDGDIMPIAPFEHIDAFTHASLMALGREAGLAPRTFLKNLARPIYRHAWPKSTFVYFARPA